MENFKSLAEQIRDLDREDRELQRLKGLNAQEDENAKRLEGIAKEDER